MPVTRNLILTFFTLVVITTSLPAFATEDTMVNEEDVFESEFASSELLSEGELDNNRGAFLQETLNLADLEALVTGNSAVNVKTGDNVVSGAAFNGTSGIVTSIQNSGNNVALQHTTIVNVTMYDSTFGPN